MALNPIVFTEGVVRSFLRYMSVLLRSYAMDAAETAEPKTVPPVEEAVKAFIEEMKAAAVERFQALGEGEDLRLESETVAGGALVDGGRVVHLAAFKVDAPTPRARRAGSRRPVRNNGSWQGTPLCIVTFLARSGCRTSTPNWHIVC